ncbi:coiled-coil domain-containing protein 55-domain containing protein [Chytriomyces cf. hyalinus JEL632]|nr:coiled-coil domain-containing protein 55-domain containing protein [Chytriomyces cf. hyalinus JEL632]
MASNGSMRNVAGGGFKFGLVKRTAQPAIASKAVKRSQAASLFDDALENSDSDGDSNANNSKARVNRDVSRQMNLAAESAKTLKLKEAALAEDQDIFDYDKVYDSMKEVEEAKKRARHLGDVDDTGRKKARYVGNLLAASLQRKIELERVEDRKVAKERQLEGEEFGDKEAFVTEAYKQRQKELRQLEEEEKRKEALQKTGGDMAVFYRTLLDSHEQISSANTLTPEQIASAAADRERREQEKKLEQQEVLEDAVKRGELKLNASNEIVDKRALLRSGLNVSRSKIRSINEEKEADDRDRRRAEEERRQKEREERERRQIEADKRRAKEEQARRLVEETERQKAEREKKRAEEAEREREEVAKKNARKATEEVVMDARARYLARKKAESSKPRDGDESE